MFFSATTPADEAVLITLPLPERTRCGIANREQRNAPVRFTASVRSQCSIGALSTVPGSTTPALLCTIWSEPNAATVFSISRAASSGEATSAATAIVRDRDRGPLPREQHRRGGADPRARPRDHGRSTVETPHPAPVPSHIVRDGRCGIARWLPVGSGWYRRAAPGRGESG